MKLEELLCLGNQTLHKDQVKLLLGSILNINPLELNLNLNDYIEADLVNKYKDCLKALNKGEPLQYAIGKMNFYGFDFYVDKRVLIPRFETEELVYNTNIYLQKYFQSGIKLLDLGCGSGCIGITLKKLNPNIKVTLSDISKEALEVALKNAKSNQTEVEIIESDLFKNINDKFSVIISNPPYVSKTDEIDEIVLQNEPHLALFSKNNGLFYYEEILKVATNYLNSKFLIAFEIGSSQKDAILQLISKYLSDVSVITKQDMSGRDRMVFIFKNIIINE